MKSIILTFLFITNLYSFTLTLQESIEKTILNHPDIKSFTFKVKQSKATYNSKFADFLPQINLQADYNPIQTFVFPANGTLTTKEDDSWSAGVYLRQKIWDFKKTSSLVESAKIDEDISKLSLDDLKALLVYKVKSFYQLMVLQQEAIKVRKKDLESNKAYYDQANALVEQGLKTKADASRFLSSVYLAEDNLAQARADFKKAKNSLSLYMGELISDDVELQTDIIKQNLTFNSNIENEIIDKNYQLKIDSQNINKNILLHKSAKASHYGSLDAIASYTHIDSLESYESSLVGLTLNIPIYSGGRTSADVQKIQIETQIANAQKASKKLELKEEIESLLIDIEKNNKTVLAKKAQLKSSNNTKDVLDARYEEGLATYIEVLDATTLVLNAELGLIEAYYLRSMAINRLEYLQGINE